MERSDKWFAAAKRCNSRDEETKIRKAVIELDQFLISRDGQVAVHQLLRVANKHVVFGKSDEFHPLMPVTVVALMGGIGGGLVMFKEEITDGIISQKFIAVKTITAEVAINAAVKYSHMEPEKIMSWLLAELDKIADSIP